MPGAKRSSTEKDIEDILHFELGPDGVDYKQITEHMRGLILSKALVAGTRLPTLTALAKLWNTSYYTVQTALTPLDNEGLLTRNQRLGTLVAGNTRKIRSVGIYSGSGFWRVKHAAFSQTLFDQLCEHFELLGIAVHLFVDSRPQDQKGTPWKPLISAIERSEVGAVVSPMPIPEAADWLGKLPVPVSMIGLNGPRRCQVHFNMDDFLRNSLVRLKERKCRSVALICGGGLPGFDSVAGLAAEIGLKCRPEWILKKDSWPEEFEDFGIESFAKIWSGSARPDGLIIYPDSIAFGVIISILQHHVRVPEDLKMIIHCNDEIYFPCPMPADWQIFRIRKIVGAIWENICTQADGKASRTVAKVMSMQPASPDYPPLFRRWKDGESLFVPLP